ncbi:hypothetical protein O5O45_28300 [Hahella aquimaris]|uniref:hypothetical protein n=1 Tax=Hahella sp. HNIBRBA332 TaxID=3015983 RepID=UPI00273B9CEB|nr:hypothetical protein [Hahella sp. HNIBRBA332]WLQ13634.1 hypothetical protein O5O45_28300 [Hahella sp. HNIBRBA332]
MNTWAGGDGWYVVGGCAAWMHIARAPRNMSEGVEEYRAIFPHDIEVVVAPAARERIIQSLEGRELVVAVGSFGDLAVDLIGGADGMVAEKVRSCVHIAGGNVLNIDDIITAYNKSGNPEKQAKRKKRVAMLKCVKGHLELNQDNIDRQKPAQSLFEEMFARTKK